MRKHKKLTTIAIILIVVGVIGSLATINTIEKPKTITKNIENNAFTTVEILSDNASIEVLPTDGETPNVEVTGFNLEKNFSTEITSETLTVKYKEKRFKFLNFSFGIPKKSIVLYLPEKEYHKVTANSSNGKINIKNLKAKEVNFTTDNGQINTEQLSTETAEMHTDNGKINVSNMTSGLTNLSTSNGKILLAKVDGEVQAKTNNGAITYEAMTLNYPLDLKTDNGRITIETDEVPTNAEIDASTDNGSITLFGEKTSRVTFGAGENKIRLQTDNGKVIVQ